MPNRTLLRELFSDEDDSGCLENLTNAKAWLATKTRSIRENSLLTGRVVSVAGDGVRVDIGFKSEGMIPLREWRLPTGAIVPPQVGDAVPVLVLDLENDEGMVVLSHSKARRFLQWVQFTRNHVEGDSVTGTVVRVIRGGLLVDVGLLAFLPASQVDIRRPANLEAYVGKVLTAEILRIDRARLSVIITRRRVLVDVHPLPFPRHLEDLAVGQVRKGVVKNIAEFGAFVDLGGIDGLLHITDMSWSRVQNAHDIVKINQELDLYILAFDRSKEKISLSLKHLTPSPWINVPTKYPIGSRHAVVVIRLMSYGAFVQLEPGIEGLVHISEMSWTQSLVHPSEIVKLGDMIEVQVLHINEAKNEISLGMRQLTPKP